MRASTYLALFAGSTAAQSTAIVLNFFQFDETLTAKGSDASATTYEKTCPSSAAGISVIPSEIRPTPVITSLSSTPASTPKARLRRQDASLSDIYDYTLCEPYIMTQGLSTWEFHLTDPTPGAWTIDMDCKWQGEMTAADLTCVLTQSGYAPDSSVVGVTSSVLMKTDQGMELYQTVAVVGELSASSSSAASNLASQTPTPSGTKFPAGSTPAAVTPSAGRAPAGPLPTGAMMFVGGAAGVFAAALAL